jgi:ABC-type uncharacterized transport system fused permease/ATPase subunit
MTLMRTELPTTTLISVGQRPEAGAFHDRRLRLVRREDGARLIAEEAPAPLRATA